MKSGAWIPSVMLLGNNALVFFSILIMTKLISFLQILLTAVRTGRLGLLTNRIYPRNNAVFVSIDLIREKNQVILEYFLMLKLIGSNLKLFIFPNPWSYDRTRPFTELWDVSMERLWRILHADSVRLLLRTPDPVPFRTFMCSTCCNLSSSRTFCYFFRLCTSNIPRYLLNLPLTWLTEKWPLLTYCSRHSTKENKNLYSKRCVTMSRIKINIP